MERLSDDAYNKILKGLFGIPVLEEREWALPLARKYLLAYEVGELELTERQYQGLKGGVAPTPSEC
ncbi:hypothetical protein KSU19_11715 [Enterobacter quasiroggenkampii]|uniref:hypothetical protein n=1 Tax=Enterobacter quasiroggenkampii TaxID=2497436 RepID=UPI0021D33658|nr:hypothetical protein [Enterobacter quasiroggenkampii]MCU6328319.1 hypothetical protein [Enterobacter quasiroggenkampii]